MLRKRVHNAAAAPALLILLTLGCESGGSSTARKPSADGTATAKLAANPAGSSVSATPSAIPKGADRRLDPVYSYVDQVRSELSDGKAGLINRVMRLTREESVVFWPIYNEYENELFALGDERIELIGKFVKANTDQSMDSAAAGSISDGWFKFESQRLELLRKYHARIAKELSPLHAAQFTQIEHRAATVVDLLIASDMPLIQPSAGR